jgi:tryptophan synthase alpha chain
MENRIDRLFGNLRREGKKGFIAYYCAGDPTMAATPEIGLALAGVGVDLLELGLPFSDPLADGSVNQLAAQRALDAGATVAGLFGAVAELRRRSEIPVVLYTYLNPLLSYGFERFHRDAAAAGVDGLLILDLPPDEESPAGLGPMPELRRIRLVAPTSTPERIAEIARVAEGFIYYVSREGVTGEQAALADSIGERVAAIRSQTALPVAVGFGISTPDQAAEAARLGDAVVVGSAIVRRIAEHAGAPDLAAKVAARVAPMVAAVKALPA